jgi:hypothetical protein
MCIDNNRNAPVTGCIRPELLSRLNPNDGGGQYDSSGGAGGLGNPQGSVCLGCVSQFILSLLLLFVFVLSEVHVRV